MKFFTGKNEGPIVHMGRSHPSASNIWTKFLQLKEDDKLHHMKKMMQDQDQEQEEEEDEVNKVVLEEVIEICIWQ
jgi:hypothetical protein